MLQQHIVHRRGASERAKVGQGAARKQADEDFGEADKAPGQSVSAEVNSFSYRSPASSCSASRQTRPGRMANFPDSAQSSVAVTALC